MDIENQGYRHCHQYGQIASPAEQTTLKYEYEKMYLCYDYVIYMVVTKII